MARSDQLPVEMKYRIRAVQLLGSVDVDIVGVQLEPWNTCRKAGLMARAPLHGSTGIVTAFIAQSHYLCLGTDKMERAKLHQYPVAANKADER